MVWAHGEEFVQALKKGRSGSEKKIHAIAGLSIKYKKWYKHVVKHVREFFARGFQPGQSKMICVYFVDAIIKAEQRESNKAYTKRFQPWLKELFYACGGRKKDHDILTKVLEIWAKIYPTEILNSLKQSMVNGEKACLEQAKVAQRKLEEAKMKNLSTLFEDSLPSASRKRKLPDQKQAPVIKKRAIEGAGYILPKVKVHPHNIDPRSSSHSATPPPLIKSVKLLPYEYEIPKNQQHQNNNNSSNNQNHPSFSQPPQQQHQQQQHQQQQHRQQQQHHHQQQRQQPQKPFNQQHHNHNNSPLSTLSNNQSQPQKQHSSVATMNNTLPKQQQQQANNAIHSSFVRTKIPKHPPQPKAVQNPRDEVQRNTNFNIMSTSINVRATNSSSTTTMPSNNNKNANKVRKNVNFHHSQHIHPTRQMKINQNSSSLRPQPPQLNKANNNNPLPNYQNISSPSSSFVPPPPLNSNHNNNPSPNNRRQYSPQIQAHSPPPNLPPSHYPPHHHPSPSIANVAKNSIAPMNLRQNQGHPNNEHQQKLPSPQQRQQQPQQHQQQGSFPPPPFPTRRDTQHYPPAPFYPPHDPNFYHPPPHNGPMMNFPPRQFSYPPPNHHQSFHHRPNNMQHRYPPFAM